MRTACMIPGLNESLFQLAGGKLWDKNMLKVAIMITSAQLTQVNWGETNTHEVLSDNIMGIEKRMHYPSSLGDFGSRVESEVERILADLPL